MDANEIKDRPLVEKISEQKFLVRLSNACYQREAIFAASYKFTSHCTILIEPISETHLGVLFEAKETNTTTLDLSQLGRDFCTEVLDQQHRLDLSKRYGHIRDLIVEHAFKPVANLKERCDGFKS